MTNHIDSNSLDNSRFEYLSLDGIKEEEIKLFIGAGTDYIAEWTKMLKNKTRLAGFNWGAFIFGSGYFFFRKMPVWGSLAIFIEFILPLIVGAIYGAIGGAAQVPIENLLKNADTIAWISTIALSIIFGLIANKIYSRHAIFTIKSIKTNNAEQSEQAIFALIKKTGGISIVLFLVSIAIRVVLNQAF